MTHDFSPPTPNLAFVPARLSRDDHLRRDHTRIESLFARDDVKILVFWRGSVLVDHNKSPRLLTAPALAGLDIVERAYLGADGDQSPWFAVGLDAAVPPPAPFEEQAFADVRMLAMVSAAARAEPLAAGRAILSWHARHRFCANCGSPTQTTYAGWRRVCANCNREHFPRVDPVVIMAVGRDDQLLLGRQANWPPGRFSCLAGFVEPGETPEAAVARESLEETGVVITSTRYIAAQPWPFPTSLMLGYLAETESEAITVDPTELEDARWFSRDEVAAMLCESHDTFAGPPPMAIAHHLIRIWLEVAETKHPAL